MQPFDELFKKYKRNVPPPDLSDVIDFDVLAASSSSKVRKASSSGSSSSCVNQQPTLTHVHPCDKRVRVIDLNQAVANNTGVDYDLQKLRCGRFRSGKEWKVFGLEGFEGFYFIQNPFTEEDQRYWISRCMNDYLRKPNVSNLDAHYELDASMYAEEGCEEVDKRNGESKEEEQHSLKVKRRKSSCSSSSCLSSAIKKSKGRKYRRFEEYRDIVVGRKEKPDGGDEEDSVRDAAEKKKENNYSNSNLVNYGKLLEKNLRWVTLGYHYDWDLKKYYAHMKGEFPQDLLELSACVVNVIYSHVLSSPSASQTKGKQVGEECELRTIQREDVFSEGINESNFRPDASIVNYYATKTTLSGHVDRSELVNAPLFSVSFGNSAIFLLGSTTKDSTPAAVFIRSGDIVLMSACARFSYHAVPKIMKDTCPHYLSEPTRTDTEPISGKPLYGEAVGKYVASHRININVRQATQNGVMP
eukprot:Nk52_evm61s223 gene=Nk52_evmTU61s223